MEHHSLLIDAYTHIIPIKYKEAVDKVVSKNWEEKLFPTPTAYDLEHRFRIMDKYENLVHVLTLSHPPVEAITTPEKAVYLAKLANDEMAELVLKYPHRFVAAVACLPLNNIEASLSEIDRAINDLRFRGILLYTHVNDKPLDSPEFIPIYEKMSQYNLPIWIHPHRTARYPDYKSETESLYRIYVMFGWPYETTVTMTRLVFSGILEKFPNIKFITHHLGGMVPYFDERIKQFQDVGEMRLGLKYFHGLTKAPIEYYKMFYNDTATYGNTSALMCGYTFFGADHILFGTDAPLGDSQLGYRNYRQTFKAIEQMDIRDTDRKKIFEDNARTLLRLPI